jgi:predicted helicase
LSLDLPETRPGILRRDWHRHVSQLPGQGRTALEWVIDRYEVTQDSNTRIIQNPNLWSGDTSYVLDLIGKVISVSLDTVGLVEQLPTLGEF